MPLYEVAILEMPSKKEVEEGTGQERLVFGPVPIVSQDPQSAAIRAILELPEAADKVGRTRMHVLVRPFTSAGDNTYLLALNQYAADQAKPGAEWKSKLVFIPGAYTTTSTIGQSFCYSVTGLGIT